MGASFRDSRTVKRRHPDESLYLRIETAAGSTRPHA